MRRGGQLPEEDPRHGTGNGYTNWGCRCEPCREAGAEINRRRRAKRIAKGLPKGDRRHGTYNAYTNWGCRCRACSEANTEYHREKARIPRRRP